MTGTEKTRRKGKRTKEGLKVEEEKKNQEEKRKKKKGEARCTVAKTAALRDHSCKGDKIEGVRRLHFPLDIYSPLRKYSPAWRQRPRQRTSRGVGGLYLSATLVKSGSKPIYYRSDNGVGRYFTPLASI